MGMGPDPNDRAPMNPLDMNPDSPAIQEEIDAAIAGGDDTAEALMERFKITKAQAEGHLARHRQAS
jgi:hypothetical protein